MRVCLAACYGSHQSLIATSVGAASTWRRVPQNGLEECEAIKRRAPKAAAARKKAADTPGRKRARSEKE